MSVITIERCCVGCRKMIPATDKTKAIALVDITLKYEEKTGKLNGKHDAKPCPALCSECIDKFKKIVAEQLAKGYKVL